MWRIVPTLRTVQRLFSAFPASWPGTGLLLLRVTVATSLLVDAMNGSVTVNHAPKIVAQSLAVGVGLCLVTGAWTPVAGALLVAIELWMLVARAGPDRTALVLAAVGASLVTLGPGAWSIDAHLYGRKRIEFENVDTK